MWIQEYTLPIIVFIFSIFFGYGYGRIIIPRITSDLAWGWILWGTMLIISIINIITLFFLWRKLKINRTDMRIAIYQRKMKLLTATFVIVCAFRCMFPNISYEHICFFDIYLSTSISSIFHGTIAKMCYIIQICTGMTHIAEDLQKHCINVWHGNKLFGLVYFVSNFVVYSIFISLCFSCYAILTMCQFWYAVEKSIQMFSLILLILCCTFLYYHFKQLEQVEQNDTKLFLLGIIFIGLPYVSFMYFEEIPMYLSNYSAEESEVDEYMTLSEGFLATLSCNEVTRLYSVWAGNVPWLIGCYNVLAWSSIWLARAPQLGNISKKRSNIHRKVQHIRNTLIMKQTKKRNRKK